jgi:hypothetical protein
MTGFVPIRAYPNETLRRHRMRGFRGSRAAANAKASQFGKNHNYQKQPQDAQVQSHEEHQAKVDQLKKLPEWMRTPETQALLDDQAHAPVAQKKTPAPVTKIAEFKAKKKTPVKRKVASKAKAKKTSGKAKKKAA